MSSYVLGLDLGKKRDYTALAVLKQTIDTESHYDLIHLDRWRDRSYRDVVPEVARVEHRLVQAANQEYLERHRFIPGGGANPDIALVVDHTGVGLAVVDDLRANGLDCTGVTIHGGDAVGRTDQDFRVPKRELVATLQVLLQSKRLGIPDAEVLPLAGVLVEELDSFTAKISLSTGHDSYGAGEDWRDNRHDDLVLAVAMAAWYGEYQQDTMLRAPEGALAAYLNCQLRRV